MIKNNEIKLWKKLITILVCLIFGLVAVGCAIYNDTVYSKDNPPEIAQFELIYQDFHNNFRIIYHKKTKVMYAVSSSGYNYGTVTLLVNEDGTPLLYEE